MKTMFTTNLLQFLLNTLYTNMFFKQLAPFHMYYEVSPQLIVNYSVEPITNILTEQLEI